MIRLENIHKSFGDHAVLRGVSGDIPKGQVLAIIGPSGSGKSTLLRSINRLAPPSEGYVYIDGQTNSHLKTGMVFQQFNLFNHMTALENVIYAPMKVKKMPRKEAEALGMALLKKMGLADKAGTYPRFLSGGQKQRVAIARALAMEPEILLFDEPTSSLDPEMVKEVLNVMKELAHTGMTMIVVTHEMGFAREVADQIWFVDQGQIIENAPTKAFFTSPQTARARRFLENVL